ncbi:hypothetical protein JCM30760_26890 [Thiomicrorhabdus hydrogeniphila]
MKTLSKTKVFLFTFLIVVATVKVISATDNSFSNYGDNSRLATVMAENSLKGGA